MSRSVSIALLLIIPAASSAQNPYRHFTEAVESRSAPSQPVVSYVLRIDAGDLRSYSVEMHIRNASSPVRVAFAAHPEYDDKYWRYIDGLTVTSDGAPVTPIREDSALWRLALQNGEATIRYRIKLPTPPETPRGAWRPFLAATGALVGGPHSFMYVVSATLAPSHVRLELPPGWAVATGLTPTAAPDTWFAPTVDALMDSPMLVGHFHDWRFAIDGVPHRVVYWSSPTATAFDTLGFVRGIKAITEQAVALFGRPPYRDFTFIMQDNAYGGLEHRNSVTLGASSAALARDVSASLPELAHEFTHTWNLMRIRPVEYGDVSWKTQLPVSGLWFSEGLTMHYADIFARRSGIPLSDSTRAAHIEGLIARYFASAGTRHFSAERISQVAYNAEPGALGDYAPSVHLIGEILGNLLDLVIRDATDDRRSMDDVMRLMLDRYSGARGFNGSDIEHAVTEVCSCNVHLFFEQHVRGARITDFNRYLQLAGLRMDTTTSTSLNRDGTPAMDLRFRAWLPEGGGALRAFVTDPASAWGRAGLHSGDQIVSINDKVVSTWPDVRAILSASHIGDTLHFVVRRKDGNAHPAVVMSGLTRVVPVLKEIGDASDKQKRIRRSFLLQRSVM